jgi:aspartate kinase
MNLDKATLSFTVHDKATRQPLTTSEEKMHSKPIVSKFGGSSLSDADQIRKVIEIIRKKPDRRYIVVSAPGKRADTDDEKITDLLIGCHDLHEAGGSFEVEFNMIAERFRKIANDLGLGLDIESLLGNIRQAITDGASRDHVASRGEWLNAQIVAEALGYEFFCLSGLYDHICTSSIVYTNAS